jgi:hypothetical protein
MSTYSDASLILPVAPEIKAGKIYSLKPTDGTGDFDFSRASSATIVNSEGLIETVATNIPRLNYPLIDGVVNGCPSLLLEPQRTNLLTYSEDFTEWTLSNSGNGQTPILTSNYTTNLGLNASRIIFNRTSASEINISSIRGNDYTQSTNTFSIYIKSNTSNVNIDFRLGSSIVTYEVTNEWKRVEFSGSDFYRSYFGLLGSSSDLYADLSIVAAQAEQGSYATSYIPTSGSAVTRVAETCNGAGDVNTFNDSEGVLYAEISALANDGTERRLSLQDNGTYDAVRITFTPTANSLTAVVYNNSANQFNAVHILDDATTFNKIAIKYKQNDFALWVNGIEVATDTNGSVFSEGSLDKLSYELNGIAKVYAKTKDLRVYNTALTDQQLQQLTKI